MEAFGYFRVTGLIHKDNLRHRSRKPLGEPGGFFGAGFLGLDGLGGWIWGLLWIIMDFFRGKPSCRNIKT